MFNTTESLGVSKYAPNRLRRQCWLDELSKDFDMQFWLNPEMAHLYRIGSLDPFEEVF